MSFLLFKNFDIVLLVEYRCLVDKVPVKSEQYSPIRQSNEHGFQIGSGSNRVVDSFPGRVSISVADVGETAVVISLVEEHQKSRETAISTASMNIDVDDGEKTVIRHLNDNSVVSHSDPDLSLLVKATSSGNSAFKDFHFFFFLSPSFHQLIQLVNCCKLVHIC